MYAYKDLKSFQKEFLLFDKEATQYCWIDNNYSMWCLLSTYWDDIRFKNKKSK